MFEMHSLPFGWRLINGAPLATPAASQAFTMATLTSLPLLALHKARMLGPAPLIAHPKAPAAFAASLTSSPPLINPHL